MTLSQEEIKLLEKFIANEVDTKSNIQGYCVQKIREYRGEYARISQILIEAEQNVVNVRRALQRISDQADKYVDDLFEWRQKEATEPTPSPKPPSET